MYLRPGSEIQAKARETQVVPAHWHHKLLKEYRPIYWQTKETSMLTQHYNHKEVDIYMYTIHTKKTIRLFANASNSRFVIGCLYKGNALFGGYDHTSLDLTAPRILFFKTIQGKELYLELPLGQHELICCCLKETYESVLQEWYTELIAVEQEIKQSSPSYWTYYLWQELISGEIPVGIYDCFISERLRTILRHLLTSWRNENQSISWEKLHPGVPLPVIQKAYVAKQYIDQNTGQVISLKQLTQKTGWNLPGLKRGFLETFGISPHRYIIQQRMNMALPLIQQTQLTIQAIARICGYQHPNQFIHQCKQWYGMTPGEMRSNKNDGKKP